MSGDQIAQLGYLVLLGLALAAGLWARSKNNLSQMLQHAAIWGFIFIGGVAVVGLWGDISRQIGVSQSVTQDRRIEVPLGRDGHYHLTLEINATPLRFVIDTGATDLVLSRADAQAAGLNLDALNFLGRAATANGVVETAPIRLDSVRLGPFTDTNVRAVVNGGEMRGSLLGMGYLQRWGRIEIAGNVLTLTR